MLILVFILIPGYIFDRVISDLARQFADEVRQAHAQKASELYSAVENEMQVAPTVQRILQDLRKTAGVKQLTEAEAKRLQSRLKKRLPVTSRYYWFDENCRLVLAPPDTSGTRVWQSLARVVTRHPSVTANDETFAFSLMKTMLSELVPPYHLFGGMNKVIDILYETLPFYFSVIPLQPNLASGTPVIGHCFAFVPRRFSSRDWELKRAMKQHTRPDRWVGGYRISSEKAYQMGNLGENLLVGLLARFRQGETEMQLGRDLYIAHTRAEDPDLMVAVGVQMPLFPDFLLPNILQWLRVLFWLALSFLIWKCVRIGLGIEPLSLSLSAKFTLVTTLLVGLPITVILFQAISQANLVRKAENAVREQRLESMLMALEQGVTSRVLSVQNGLLKTMRLPEIGKGIEKEHLEHLLRKVSSVGLLQYIYLNVSGLHLQRSFEDDTTGSRTQLNLVLGALSATDFKFPLNQISSSTASITSSLGTLILKPDQLESMLDHLEPQQLGNRYYYMFSSFAYDTIGSKSAFLSVSIPFAALRDRFLEETRSQIITSGSDMSLFFEGEQSPFPQINQFLETSIDAERTFHAAIRRHGVSYLAIGRPLRGLRKRALVLSPLQAGGSTALTYGQMALVVLLALIAALITASDLIRVFLEPVRSLLWAVRSVDRGDLSVSLAAGAPDELGRLTNRFNGMVEGLLERSRMCGFLRSDLLESGGEQLIQRAERRPLTILFAGIRDFSRLEAALTPEAAMQTMSHYLELCSQAVREAGGQIDKFIGDTAMAVFLDDKSTQRSAAEQSIHAATHIVELVQIWNRQRQIDQLSPVACGVGIAAGEAVTGSIGSKRKRLDFTAIGDTVNLAARLEKLAARADTAGILVAGMQPRQAPVGWVWHKQPLLNIRGKTEQVEVLGLIAVDAAASGVTHD